VDSFAAINGAATIWKNAARTILPASEFGPVDSRPLTFSSPTYGSRRSHFTWTRCIWPARCCVTNPVIQN